jgi:hypothetical protein
MMAAEGKEEAGAGRERESDGHLELIKVCDSGDPLA